MTTTTAYDAQAKAFLAKHGLTLTISAGTDQCPCPPWCTGNRHIHGLAHWVTLSDQQPHNVHELLPGEAYARAHARLTLEFVYWNSYQDKQKGKSPTAYDVLACLASDARCSTDPDEIYADFGEMTPSNAIAIAAHAKEIQDFFTQEELDDLSEIS